MINLHNLGSQFSNDQKLLIVRWASSNAKYYDLAYSLSQKMFRYTGYHEKIYKNILYNAHNWIKAAKDEGFKAADFRPNMIKIIP